MYYVTNMSTIGLTVSVLHFRDARRRRLTANRQSHTSALG